MATRYVTAALTGLIVLLLGGALLSQPEHDVEAEVAPEYSATSTDLRHLTVEAPDSVLRGETVTLVASSTNGPVDEVGWLEGSSPAEATGGTYTFVAERIGTAEVIASVEDDFGRRTQVRVKIEVLPNALDGDDDGDGLTNREEIALGSSSDSSDTDNDGLDDFSESVGGTNPNSSDTDGDAMDDHFEVLYGLDPTNNDGDGDIDADGYTNLVEYELASNPRNPRFTPDSAQPTQFIAADGATVSEDGTTATFSAETTLRSTTVVRAGSGLFYFEARQTEGELGVIGLLPGNAELVGPSELLVGFSAQIASADHLSGTPVGLIVDARSSNLAVWPITSSPEGPQVGDRVEVGVQESVAIAATGHAGDVITINAGDDPYNHRFAYGAHYLLFNTGVADAEFMSLGWGAVNTYNGPESVTTFSEVRLVLNDHSGEGVKVASDGRTVSYSPNDGEKQVVRANQGMIGEFRYWESTRLYATPANVGQGILTEYSLLDPYPRGDGEEPSQPGMSVNSMRGIWQYPRVIGSYDADNNTVIGFAVDYTGARPVVHVIIGNELVQTVVLDDIFTPVYPVMYGTVGVADWMHEANFGADAFVYDVQEILATAGVGTADLQLGWGVHEGVAAADTLAFGDGD